MKKFLYTALSLSVITLVSCGERTVGNSRVQPVTPVAAPTTASSAITPIVTTATNTVPNTTAKLNPAHGLPGHRCDLAVGAALPANNAQPNLMQVTTPPVTTTLPQNIQTTPVAAGLNPAHGQPNHRCDIAVGAPLDSK